MTSDEHDDHGDGLEPPEGGTRKAEAGEGPAERRSDARTVELNGTGSPGEGADLHDSGPPTEGIRIAAVEAAVAAGLVPSKTRTETVEERPEPGFVLPDWTDPPTGQVPRVLLDEANTDDRDDPDDLAAMRGPTWRELGTDWNDDLDLSFLVDRDEDPRSAIEDQVGETDPFDFSGLDVDSPSAAGRREPVGVAETRELPNEGNEAPDPSDVAWAALLRGSPEPGIDARLGARDGGAVVSGATDHLEDPGPRGRRRRHASRTATRRGEAVVARRPDAARAAGPRPTETASPPTAGDRLTPMAVGTSPRRDARLATITGVIAGLIALGCFLAGAALSLALVTVVVTLAAGEAFGSLRRAGHHPATILGLVATPALVIGAYLKGSEAIPLVLALTVVLSMCWYLLGVTRESPTTGLGVTMLVVFWVGGLGSFAGLLLAPASYPNRHGVAFLAAVVLITVAHDVGSYAFGAKFGRRRLAPSISPGKTWEGYLGGSLVALLVAGLAVGRIHPFDWGNALVLGLVVCVLGPLGDLAESLIKRDLGVKDMGSLLPAHGGLLDRVDSMLFVLPAAYYLVRLFNLG